MVQEQAYQAVTLVAAVSFFDFLERRRPGFQVNRRRELSLNILAILIVIGAGEFCKTAILAGFGAAGLEGFTLASLRSLPGWAKILLAIVMTDFSLYWVHRCMHTPLLWRTHTFHHTIPEIWWLSGARTSVTHLFLFAVPQILIGYYLLSLSPTEAGIAYSFAAVVNLWIHTNIWVNLGPLEWLLITPNFHRVHHGATGLGSRNLAFVFTLWDRMFGTYVDPGKLGKEFNVFSAPTRGRVLRLIAGI
jgi:sterol desaturase/sphingolipid hydroxylase (fatty acid hydroxylase superfamily)